MEQASASEARQALHEELARLPEHHRAPLVLCYLEGRTHDEAAAQLGWTLTVFRGRLDRGRQGLRKRLQRRGLSLGAGLAALEVGSPRASATALAVTVGRAALGPQAGVASGAVSPAVSRLTREVLLTMAVSRFALVAVALVALTALGYLGYRKWWDQPDTGAVPEARPDRKEGEKLTGAEVERRAAAVYDRAGRALVRIEREDGKPLGGYAGVIVTADGHVLYRAVRGGGKRTFRLSDGRRVTGTHLGWSVERGVGLAKLDGPGPWPFVPLANSAGVKAGQCVVTLAYPDQEAPELTPRPLLDVGGVTGSAVGRWFVLKDAETARWRNAPAVFDLDGRLVGVGWHRYADGVGLGTVYTDAKVVRALWGDLVAGKDVEGWLRGSVRGPGVAPDRPAKGPIPQAVVEKARAASVRIRRDRKDRGGSGTIVTADGFVVTCAHGFDFVLPGTKVLVCLPDGRDAAGEVVGLDHLCDTCLVRITDKGPWPHVEMGDSTRLHPGDPCLFFGYGPGNDDARQPYLRQTSVAKQWAGLGGHVLGLDPKTTWYGGDSGGGVFDADGRLVAYFFGGTSPASGGKPQGSTRIEVFRSYRDELTGPYEQAAAAPLAAAQADLRRATAGVQRCVVEVHDAKGPVALGTVVGRDGRILTLASALPEAPACRLPDGRVLPARVVAASREHNLALLKVEAAGLPVADWSKADEPRVGALVALMAFGHQPAAGFVSHPTLSIPAEQGNLWVNVRDSARGLEVAKVWEMGGPSLLRKGDIVLSIGGHPTPNREEYLKLWQREKGAPIAGDRVSVAITREGKKVELRSTLSPPNWPRPDGQGPRCSGFPRAYSVAVAPESPLCGGPVLDREGRVLGVAIAWRSRGWLLVLPAAAARAVAGDSGRPS